MLNEVSQICWKKFMEGMRRGDVPSYERFNIANGDDVRVEFMDGETLVARMLITDANKIPGQKCPREFYMTQEICDATAYIYVPTQAEMDEWDGDGLDIGEEMIKRDPGYGT
jgi:hypothetical protein